MTTTRARTRGAHRDDGAVAVEFVFLLPILIVILFGITAFGVALNRFVTYLSAAREGARYAAVSCSPDSLACTSTLIQNRVTSASIGAPIGPGVPTASIDCSVAPGSVVTVSWDQDILIQIPLLPDMSQTVTISGSFRCE